MDTAVPPTEEDGDGKTRAYVPVAGAGQGLADDDFSSSDNPNALPKGHPLHHFVIRGLIGAGGFGIVYCVYDTQLQRTVVIKEYMPMQFAERGRDLRVVLRSPGDAEAFAVGLRSFLNEARLLASFEHPALVKVYSFWEEDGTAYMVMPYYKGPTLEAWLQRHGAPDEAWLLALIKPLIEALALIHSQGCFHRDVSPDNILLLGPSQPVLLDFGAARRMVGEAGKALTSMLKPGYGPIEQYGEARTLKQGPWTDVYALCAVLYSAVTGRVPMPAATRLANDELVPAVRAGVGRYTPEFLATIDRGLQLYPADRPQSMGELRKLFFPHEVLPAAPEGGLRPGKRAPGTPPNRWPRWWLEAGLAAGAVAGLTWLLIPPIPSGPTPEPPAVAQPAPFGIVPALEDLVRHADPAMAVETRPDQTPMVIGQDRLQFRVKSRLGGYLYVYSAGTDGKHLFLLFPNGYDGNNRIEPEQELRLPRAPWFIAAEGPPGYNHIVTVVSQHPLDLSGAGLKQGEIPEFDQDAVRRLWEEKGGKGTTLLGTPQCAVPPCQLRFGAAMVRIEEVAAPAAKP